MKTLDLTPYAVTVMPAKGAVAAVIEPYPMLDSLVNILFGRAGLKAREILQRDDVARKILACGSDHQLTLEDAEYALVKNAVETLEGYGRNDAELIRRIL